MGTSWKEYGKINQILRRKCAGSVGRVWRECWDSVGRLWKYCVYVVGIVCGERGEVVEILCRYF